jgi:hypothetical protein
LAITHNMPDFDFRIEPELGAAEFIDLLRRSPSVVLYAPLRLLLLMLRAVKRVGNGAVSRPLPTEILPL